MMLERAIKAATYLEGKLRPHGWHVALTGSTLYGMGKAGPPQDIDLIIYPHRNKDGSVPDHTMKEIFALAGIEKIEQVVSEEYEGQVYVTHLRTGEKVNAWLMFYEEPEFE